MRLKDLCSGRRRLRAQSLVYRIMEIVDEVNAKQLFTKPHNTLELVRVLFETHLPEFYEGGWAVLGLSWVQKAVPVG